ncbi:MAG TPA: hypothetical protein VHE33_14615 [Acidobacteriaceae bacterium]|nr:hypothetical protein [Acidobacteriaceae bacterium]
MARVLVVAECEDPKKWRENFVKHVDLFRSMGATAPVSFGLDGNSVAVMLDVKDLNAYQKILQSQATAEAMAMDGLRRETVKAFVLDGQLAV